MNKILMALTVGLMTLLFGACGGDNSSAGKEQTVDKVSNTEGLKLMESKCYACHNPKTESHDVIIAPPMIAVKKHYLWEYESKEDFVNAIVNWSLDPKEENALMPGAVNRFKVMPKQNFAKADLEKIAAYIFDHDIEKPKWFGAHEKEMHGGGGGMGNNWKKAIALKDGKKWKSDEATTKHIQNLQKIMKDNQAGAASGDVEALHKIAAAVEAEIDVLLKDCTMEGPNHDALHQFLMPLMKKNDKLKETPTALMGKKIFEKMKTQMDAYTDFFE